MKIFSIRDNAADAYMQPWFSRNVETARREVSEAVNSGDHQFARHAHDYALWEIGEFDETTGNINAYPPQFCSNLIDFKLANEATPLAAVGTD